MPIRIACAVIAREGRVLLGHRHPKRLNYPDCWDLIGGHVEPGESAHHAVRRECREEIGIGIVEVERVSFQSSDPALDMRVFVVTRWQGEPINLAPDEHDELRWFTPAELAGLTLADPGSRTLLADAAHASASGRGRA